MFFFYFKLNYSMKEKKSMFFSVYNLNLEIKYKINRPPLI